MLLREDRAARRDTAHERQRQLREARQRQAELLAAALVERAQCVRLQANAARRAPHQLDDALARQGLQVFFGRIGRAKAQLRGDLGPRRRCAGALDGALHQVENLLLAIGEFRSVLHVGSSSVN